MNTVRLVVVGFVMSGGLASPPQDVHPTCGQISGNSSHDLQRIRKFCDITFKKAAGPYIKGVHAVGTALWISVDRNTRIALTSDRFEAKRLVLGWMRGWKRAWGIEYVKVHVEWEGIKIATGASSLFSGDEVTLH